MSAAPSIRFTNQQLQQFLDELKAAGAELNENPVNGTILADYILRHKLEPTVENLHKAKDALVTALDWKVAPKQKPVPGSKPFIEQKKSAIASENDFAAKVREGEARDAKQKADEASQRQTENLIENYLPVSNGRIQHGKRANGQERLREAVQQCRKRGDSWQSIAKKVEAKIQSLYAEDQRSAERL